MSVQGRKPQFASVRYRAGKIIGGEFYRTAGTDKCDRLQWVACGSSEFQNAAAEFGCGVEGQRAAMRRHLNKVSFRPRNGRSAASYPSLEFQRFTSTKQASKNKAPDESARVHLKCLPCYFFLAATSTRFSCQTLSSS